MSDISVGANIAVDSPVLFPHSFKAGAALTCGDTLRLASDGFVYPADSDVTTVSGYSDYIGFATEDVDSGQPVTPAIQGTVFADYATGMTINAALYISSNAGLLSDAKIAANDTPVALAISATDILVLK